MSDKGLTPEGSSVATALAAGLAALVMFCVQLSDKELPDMKDAQKIRWLFEFLSGRGSGKYVNVRNLLQLQAISPRGSKNPDLETWLQMSLDGQVGNNSSNIYSLHDFALHHP